MKKLLVLFLFSFLLLSFFGCNNDENTDIICKNCGSTIADNSKFCSECGTVIEDSTNNDSTGGDDNNVCSHNWISPSCITPKTCSKCGETNGDALGHTTTTGICDRCGERQGWSKSEIQSIIKIYDIFVSDIDSADGVDMQIAWENTSSKTIKYIYFTVEAYNAVDDKVSCDVREHYSFTGKSTGPFETGYTNLVYDSLDDEYYVDTVFENCYYNNTIRYFKLTEIEIIYMDNSTVILDDSTAIEYAFCNIPQGLYYTWDDNYNGYEVNYRLKQYASGGQINIPETYNNFPVVSIADFAFSKIESLKEVNLPNTIKHIGWQAFWECSNIQQITIPNSVISLDHDAFGRCSSLKSIIIPNNVTNIGSGVFAGCLNLDSITFENNSKILSIGDGAFSECSFTSIEIPNSVANIGGYIFSGCTRIKSITIPFIGKTKDDGEHLGYLFSGPGDWSFGREYVPSSLKTIAITKGTSIDFDGCSNLESITLPEILTAIGDSAFRSCSGIKSIKIPSSVTNIGESAFYGCTSLENIEIPNTIKNIGSNAFENCDSLLYNKYENAYYLGNNENLYLVLIKSLNTSITSCFINANTKIIYSRAFQNCDILSTIEIPVGVEIIGDYAFSNCSNIMAITIPNSIIKIGTFAFSGCSNLLNIIIPNGVIDIGAFSFNDCTNLLTVSFAEDIQLKSIKYDTFYNCNSLKSIIIPNSVETIGESAFQGCSSLESIVIPKSVKTIDRYAFFACFNLVIYAEVLDKPSGWDSQWNSAGGEVVWGYNS